MGFRIDRSERSRHLVLRLSSGEIVPDAIAIRLREEQVTCGWLRGSGVLSDVELRGFNPEMGALGSIRRIGGSVQALSLEAGVGLVGGEPSLSLRAILARESDRGLETFAGEIASARTIGLEVVVTTFDDVTLDRSLDEAAGVWLFDAGSLHAPAVRPGAPAPARAASPGARAPNERPARGMPGSGWTAAVEASADVERDASAGRSSTSTAASPSGPVRPQRPARPGLDLDSPAPEAGDVVEHFAFGRCDVLRSDGDRLHLRVGKDGRIREIALEMLRVVRLDEGSSTGKRRFKLERRI